jgi:hypothetical protein
MRNIYKILVENPAGKRPVSRPRRRGEDNIRMDLREIGWEGVEWIQNKDRWRSLEPSDSLKGEGFLDYLSGY